MKLKFDANQPFQLEAINAIVDVFDGQPIGRGDFETTIKFASSSMFKNRLGYGNSLEIDRETIQKNLIKIQKQNRIFQPHSLQSKGLNFSVEMETGTGKTYVYLRTILEFNRQYAFNKFIIVVPSVAIREGVLKSIDIMKEHFLELYNNIPFSHFVYDSKRTGQLRSFATGNALQIMIINIDSFNKRENNRLSGNSRGRNCIFKSSK